MKLSNIELAIEVAEHGAELVSLVCGGREYMWNADPVFWNRHAPILFPAVGKPFNKEVRIGGKVRPMGQHGFARDCEFKEIGPGLMRMIDDGSHAESYPYKYILEAEYRLDGRKVIITWTAKNVGEEDMYAQIGAHPGFMLPDYKPADELHGYIRYYDKEGRAVSPVEVSELDGGNRVPHAAPVQFPAEMPVKSDTFNRDALIFEDGQVTKAVLCDREGKPVLSVDCPQAQAYGIWAPKKEGCPFVCLEPWCGICDAKDYTGDISGRTYVHRIAPGDKYTFTYIITIE